VANQVENFYHVAVQDLFVRGRDSLSIRHILVDKSHRKGYHFHLVSVETPFAVFDYVSTLSSIFHPIEPLTIMAAEICIFHTKKKIFHSYDGHYFL